MGIQLGIEGVDEGEDFEREGFLVFHIISIAQVGPKVKRFGGIVTKVHKRPWAVVQVYYISLVQAPPYT